MAIGVHGALGNLAVQHVEQETKQRADSATARLQLLEVQAVLDPHLTSKIATFKLVRSVNSYIYFFQ